MEYASGDHQGHFEAFSPPRDDTYLALKFEAHRGWDRDGSDPLHSSASRMMYEGQRIDASRSYYQGQSQRQDSRMHLERHGSSDNRSSRADMDIEKSPFPQTFEALDDISKLAKELNDAEDAENTRHREKINAINAQYQEQFMSKHANRRDEFL